MIKEKHPSCLLEVKPLCFKSAAGFYGRSTLQTVGKDPPAIVSTPARQARLQAALCSQHCNLPQLASVVDCRRHKDEASDQLGPVGREQLTPMSKAPPFSWGLGETELCWRTKQTFSTCFSFISEKMRMSSR